MDGIRRLCRVLPLILAAAVVGLVAGPTAARAAASHSVDLGHSVVFGDQRTTISPRSVSLAVGTEVRADPPDVRGLSVNEARARLEAWDKAVVIQTLPQPVPAGIDPSTVVVATQTLVNTVPGTNAARPQVRLGLGTRVPDLTGLTTGQASQVLASHGLKLQAPPAEVRPEWTVNGQTVPPEQIVEFGLTIGATYETPVTEPDLRTIALIGGAGLLVVLLLGLLAVRALRRRSRRRRTPTESIIVRGHPGPVAPPSLVESDQPDVLVGLRPRYDPGAFTFEEVRR